MNDRERTSTDKAPDKDNQVNQTPQTTVPTIYPDIEFVNRTLP